MSQDKYMQYDPAVLQQVQQVEMDVLADFSRICEEHALTYFLIYGTAIGAVRHKGFIPWDDDIDVGMFRDDYEKFMQICKAQPSSEYEILSVETTPENASSLVKYQKKGTSFIAWHSRFLKNNIGIAIDIFPFDFVIDDDKALEKQMTKAIFLARLLYLSGTPYPHIPMQGLLGLLAKCICYVAHYMLKLFHVSPQWIFRKFEAVVTQHNKTQHEYVSCFLAPASKTQRWKKSDMVPCKSVVFETITSYVPKNVHDILTDTYGDYMKVPPEGERVNHCPYKLSFHDTNAGDDKASSTK